MRPTRLGITIGSTLGLLLLAALAVPSLASSHITVQPLTGRSAFTDEVNLKIRVKLDGHATETINIDPTTTQTAIFTVQPGAMFPWHSHPGTVIVNVASGELVYVASSDCVERHYAAGTSFVDAGFGHVHTAYNPGSEPTVLVATFFGLPPTGPLSMPVDPPADCVVTP